MNELLLMDSYAWIYRSFYAVRSLTNSRGVPSNAVFAMMRFLLKLEDEFPARSGGFIFDCGKPAHRLALAPDYKANRPPMPEELKVQLPVIRTLIGAFGWPSFESEGYEADDLIACIAHAVTDRPVRIVSGDKDLSQLIDDRVTMLVPSPDGKQLLPRGVRETEEKFGVPPSLIVDYLALVGDSSDNIPGVPGVGPKTAAALLRQFGSIDAMLASPQLIARESLREKIASAGELLKKNRLLVSLKDDPPPGFAPSPDSFSRKAPDWNAVLAVAQDMEFRSMFRELEARRTAASAADPAGPVQLELF